VPRHCCDRDLRCPGQHPSYTLAFSSDRITRTDASFIAGPFAYPNDLAEGTIGPIGALQYFGNLVWNTIATLSFYQNSTHLELLIDMYSVLPKIFEGNNTAGPYDGNATRGNLIVIPSCGSVFTSPTEKVFDSFKDIMFRMAYMRGPNDTQIEVEQTVITFVYESNNAFLGCRLGYCDSSASWLPSLALVERQTILRDH
jgi:hypothetical protein